MKHLFPIIALCAILLDGCCGQPSKLTRITRLGKQYDKFIALTFDDGPSSLTPQVLDLLEKYDATATFFVIGNQVDATTEPTTPFML